MFSPRSQIKSIAQTLLLNQANGTSFGHPFHLVNPSVLPLAFSVATFSGFQMLLYALRFESSFVDCFTMFHGVFFTSMAAVVLSWVLETAREENRGAHTIEVQRGFRLAVTLFITSELMLFVAFFWSF